MNGNISLSTATIGPEPVNTVPFILAPKLIAPFKHSEADRQEIADKISEFIFGHSFTLIFFEFREEENLYYLIHHGHRQISFSKDDALVKKTKQAVKKFLHEVFNPIDHIINFKNLIIIDLVRHRTYTTTMRLIDNINYYHKKMPYKTKPWAERFFCGIARSFLSDTFKHFEGKKTKWK